MGSASSVLVSTHWSLTIPVVPLKITRSQLESAPYVPVMVSPVTLHCTPTMLPAGIEPTALAVLLGPARITTPSVMRYSRPDGPGGEPLFDGTVGAGAGAPEQPPFTKNEPSWPIGSTAKFQP